ncbi:MAG: hypothetical protein U0234_12170 [Sandaracinus sp.]
MKSEEKSQSCGCTARTESQRTEKQAPACACGEACRCGDQCRCAGCSHAKR